MVSIPAEVVLYEVDASFGLGDGSPHLHHPSDEDLRVRVEVLVVGRVGSEKPVSMVGVISGTEDVDDCGD